GLALLWGRIDVDDVHAWAEHINPFTLFAALVLLPLCTFPVTPLNIVAGVRFGFVGGLLMIAAAIVVQHCIAFATARVLPGMLRRRLEPLRARLPDDAHRDAAVFTSLLPGAPYWTQLYVLPVMGVPLVTLLLVS